MSAALAVNIAVPEKSEHYADEEEGCESSNLQETHREGAAGVGVIVFPKIVVIFFLFLQQTLIGLIVGVFYVRQFVSEHCEKRAR